MNRVILLTGGNAAGKTTLLKSLEARWAPVLPAWHWLYGDAWRGRKETDTKRMLGVLRNELPVIMEGRYVYATLYRSLQLYAGPPLQVWVANLLQEGPVGDAHVKARQAKNRRKESAKKAYWDDPTQVTKRAYDAKNRYENAAREFHAVWQAGQAPGVEGFQVQDFLIDDAYTEHVKVAGWVESLLVG